MFPHASSVDRVRHGQNRGLIEAETRWCGLLRSRVATNTIPAMPRNTVRLFSIVPTATGHGKTQEDMRLEAERVKTELEALRLEREAVARAEEADRAAEEEARRAKEAQDAAEAQRYSSYTRKMRPSPRFSHRLHPLSVHRWGFEAFNIAYVRPFR